MHGHSCKPFIASSTVYIIRGRPSPGAALSSSEDISDNLHPPHTHPRPIASGINLGVHNSVDWVFSRLLLTDGHIYYRAAHYFDLALFVNGRVRCKNDDWPASAPHESSTRFKVLTTSGWGRMENTLICIICGTVGRWIAFLRPPPLWSD